MRVGRVQVVQHEAEPPPDTHQLAAEAGEACAERLALLQVEHPLFNVRTDGVGVL